MCHRYLRAKLAFLTQVHTLRQLAPCRFLACCPGRFQLHADVPNFQQATALMDRGQARQTSVHPAWRAKNNRSQVLRFLSPRLILQKVAADQKTGGRLHFTVPNRARRLVAAVPNRARPVGPGAAVGLAWPAAGRPTRAVAGVRRWPDHARRGCRSDPTRPRFGYIFRYPAAFPQQS